MLVPARLPTSHKGAVMLLLYPLFYGLPVVILPKFDLISYAEHRALQGHRGLVDELFSTSCLVYRPHSYEQIRLEFS